MKFIIGKKVEMSQRFKEDGTVVPVTLVYAPPSKIAQIKTKENDGYDALQAAAFTVSEKKLTKPLRGHLKDMPAYATLKELRMEGPDASLEKGKELSVSQFAVGDKVEVTGTSKGKGFQGVVKRHGFHGHPASHGHKDQLRMPGSIGGSRGGRGKQEVLKGKRMAGHMGTDRITVKNLEVIEIDDKNNLMAIKGAIPGARNSVVYVTAK